VRTPAAIGPQQGRSGRPAVAEAEEPHLKAYGATLSYPAERQPLRAGVAIRSRARCSRHTLPAAKSYRAPKIQTQHIIIKRFKFAIPPTLVPRANGGNDDGEGEDKERRAGGMRQG
jgi:hypothetical protein